MRLETTNDGKSRRESAQRHAFRSVKPTVRQAANAEGNEPIKLRSRSIGRQADSPAAPNHATKSLISLRKRAVKALKRIPVTAQRVIDRIDAQLQR